MKFVQTKNNNKIIAGEVRKVDYSDSKNKKKFVNDLETEIIKY